jgi:hypothetical protein
METIRLVIAQTWIRFEGEVVRVLPPVLATVAILAIGVLAGLVVRRLANRALASRHLERHAARLGLARPVESIGIARLVDGAARGLQWGIIGLAGIVALYSLDARVASDLTERLLLYLPHLTAAVIILAIGAAVAGFAGRSVLIAAVNSEIRAAPLLAVAARAAVMLVAFAIAAEHLGVGPLTVLTAFAILFGGVTLAASIAVGLALQEFVRRWMSDYLDRLETGTAEETIRHW